jgi:oligopeptide transport system substrate-binding protein
MKSWTPHESIVLEKDPLFFDAASVRLDEVDWLDASDVAAAFRRYRAGELDWAVLDRNTVKLAREILPNEILYHPQNALSFVFFNMTKGPISQDLRLRQAIDLAIDRDTVIKVAASRSVPAYSLVPPVVTDYTPQTSAYDGKALSDIPMDQRLAKAKALVAEAGYGPDNHFKLSVSYTTDEATRQVLVAIKQMLLPVGIELGLDNMEWQVFIGRVNQHDVEAGRMGTTGSYVDAESSLSNFWGGANLFNFTGYKNPEFDRLFEQVMTEMDLSKRRQLAQQCERIAMNDLPIIPLSFPVAQFVVKPNLAGFVGNTAFPQSRYLSFKQ